MFDELILHGDHIYQKSYADKQNVVIPVRLPWYRNLAMAVLYSLKFTIDGRCYASSKDEVKVLVDGEPVSLKEITTDHKYTKVIWCNLDTQKAIVALDSPLTEGDHEVKLEMTINLPYHMPVHTKASEDGIAAGDEDVDVNTMSMFPQFVEYQKTMKFEEGVL